MKSIASVEFALFHILVTFFRYKAIRKPYRRSTMRSIVLIRHHLIVLYRQVLQYLPSCYPETAFSSVSAHVLRIIQFVDQTYLGGLKTTVNHITEMGTYVLLKYRRVTLLPTTRELLVLNPHNFLRHNSPVIANISNIQARCKKLTVEFKSNSNVDLEVQNELWDIPTSMTSLRDLTATNVIHAAGATSRVILV